MPKYNFLGQEKKLNKSNFKKVFLDLYNNSKEEDVKKDDKIGNYYHNIDMKNASQRLDYFIDITKKYISKDSEEFILRNLRLNASDVRKYAISYLKEKLLKYCNDVPRRDELITLLDDKVASKQLSISDFAKLVKMSVEDKYKEEISDSRISMIPNSVIAKQFSKYVDLLDMDISDMDNSDDVLEDIETRMNSFMTIYDYSYDIPLTTPKYENETNEIISYFSADKEQALTPQEINELKYANSLFGEPTIDIESLEKDKIELDNAVAYNHLSKAKDNLKSKDFEPEIITLGRNNKYGYYNKVNADKINELKNLRDNTDITYSYDTKKGILHIVNLIRESKLEKDYILNDSDGKVYGFNKLRDLGNKYKEAITSDKIEDKIKAISYANEIKELDDKISNILNEIGKFVPLDKDNLAFENDLDLLNNKDIPAKYRIDYQRIAHLSTLCSLINLIDKYGYDLNEFLDEPMSVLRDLYQKEYLNQIDPSKNNKELSGVDLLFNLSKKPDANLANEFLRDIPKLAIGLAYLEQDKKLRMDNAATIYAMNETIFKPYIFAYKYDSYNLNNSIDRLIINPNLTFDDLQLNYYDPDKLSFMNMDNNGFDEIAHIKNSNESYEDFKARFDLNLLKYMKLESQYIRENNDVDSVYFRTAKYVELASKALAKVLIVKREDKDNPSYQELKKFLDDKKTYVNSLIDSIPNNPKYSDYLALKELKDKEIKVGNKLYKINTFERKNEISSVLNNYDKFVSELKQSTKINLKDFIKNENDLNIDLKKKYLEFDKASNNYQKMIETIYGPSYKGEVNNLLNDDIKNAFIAYTDTKRIYVDAKNKYLEDLDAKIKAGEVPSSYYMDRVIQIDVNDYSKLPPLFRSDVEMDKDEYIKFRYPLEYDTLSAEEKDLVFEKYQYEMKAKENDFFARKYLELESLTSKKDNVISKNETKEIDTIDYRLLENSFLNLEKKYINALAYERPREPFNELTSLREQSDSITDFKKNLDEKILSIIKGYDNGTKVLPSIDKVIDYSQKAALKYLLVVTTYNRDHPDVKALNDYLVDGKAYIANLINKENEKLDESSRIKYDIKKANIDELSINKYSNSMKDFNDYYNKEIKNTSLIEDLLYEEEDASRILKELNEYAKELRQEKKAIQNNYMHAPVEPLVTALSIAGIERDEYLAMSIDERIEDCKESYNYILSGIYTILDYYYSRGYIPAEYVEERLKRLNNHNYDIPTKYTVDGLPGMEKYIKTKYPTLAQELTHDEKKNIYLNYIRECEENRRQFILHNYFTKNDLTAKRLYNFEDLNIPQIDNGKNAKEMQKQIYEDIENNLKIESDKDDIALPAFDNISEVSMEDINLNDMADLDLLDDVNPKTILNEEKDDIRKNDHFTKWIDNLKKVIKDELGPVEYEEQSIEEHFKYDPVHDSFNYWLDDHLQALDMIFEDNLNDVFAETTNMLDKESRDIFAKEIVNLPEFRKYFEKEIQEFAYTPLYESPAEENYNLENENAEFTNFIRQLKKDLNEKEMDLDDEVSEDIEENEIIKTK